MTRRQRLDAELVRRGLARSREHASSLIEARQVTVAGTVAAKSATVVGTDQAIVVRSRSEEPDFASRGAHKLIGALEAFGAKGLEVADKRCLDAGASTGGFTDVLLRRGAREVVAADVGYGQLTWRLQQDTRVRVLDRTNVREIDADRIGGVVDLVVADLSFISLAVVLPALAGVTRTEGDLVLMVKPQFEVGRERLGKKGVVRDPDLHADAVWGVCRAADGLGWGTRGVVASPLPGPAGNVEYFGWFRTDAGPVVEADLRHAIAEGPLSKKGQR